MTIHAGKSGRYRYYTCAQAAQKGKTTCIGRSIPLAALDDMILGHLADRLFTSERLEIVLKTFIAKTG